MEYPLTLGNQWVYTIDLGLNPCSNGIPSDGLVTGNIIDTWES